MRVGGSAPQSTTTKGPSARPDSSCRARAATSLPVPDSPVSSTVVGVDATFSMSSNTLRICVLRPMSGPQRVRADSGRSTVSEVALSLILVSPSPIVAPRSTTTS